MTVEGYQKIVALLSQVSPQNKDATLIVVTRTWPWPK